MRKFIDIINEGSVVPFPGNNKPTSNLAVAQGGAEVRGFPEKVPLDAFTHAYVVCALWSSHDDDGEPLDDEHGIEDIASPTLKKMAEDCKDFQDSNRELLDQAYEQPGYDESYAGHDFWLTREGHGAGFWDRGLGEVGEELTKASKSYGGFDLYIGGDGMIHR